MLAIQQHMERARRVLSQHYASVHEIAQGKNGIVFSAHKGDPAGPVVAIKVAYPSEEGVPVPDSVLRFRRECEIGSALNHPHILRYAPVQVIDGVELFEMEFAGPLRLDNLVTAPRPPHFDRVMSIMHELADALDYAHAHGVVHGALTPSKVLLDVKGHLHVKGFMLLKDLPAAHPALSPAAVGNAAFMAPEQWKLGRVDRGVDIYAAGVIAYELCTGARRVSMDGSGVPEIRPIELAPNKPLREGFPLHINSAIRRATTREPTARYASVGELVQAMSNTSPLMGKSLPTLRPRLVRQRTSLWMMLAIVVGVVTLTVLALPESMRQRLLTSIGAVLSGGAP